VEPIDRRQLLPKILYGSLFTLVLPILLFAWATASSAVVHINAVHSRLWGMAVASLGLIVIATGMLALYLRGGGLPMNAYPPPRFVRTGIYGVVPHPIYGGFVILTAGVAIALGSASGLWVVTPVVAMASSALVLGYELPDLRRRFGPPLASLWLPLQSDTRPTPIERIRQYFTLLLPWLVLYEAVVAIGIAPDAINTCLSFESRLPVLQWTEIIYGSTYIVVLLAPFLLPSRNAARLFAVRGYTAMALIFPLYFLLPFVAPARAFVATSTAGDLLNWERMVDSAGAAFPSYHVVWALIAASALGEGSTVRRVFWYVWAALVSLSCITTGMHSVIDVVGGFTAFALIVEMPAIWKSVLVISERIANSWHEWRFGPVRVINHGAYAGAGTFVGMCVISAIVGPNSQWLVISVYVGATVGAALWAQWVEGSPSLLRPLGFYGGLIGSILGAFVAVPLGISVWTALGALCIAAPFIQALGRLRCLVQGCCHGQVTQSVAGICYSHPRSRVCRLAGLSGVRVHATQVYSILWNIVVAAALLRLFSLHSSNALICGAYLVLSGIGRFVEEAYRGEPQTKILGGLRLYQWLSIVTVVAGASLTTVRNTSPVPSASVANIQFGLAALCGFSAWFVTGIDFPESSRRFARLT
jgi:protein-S-isoprenylcysteine O-methyltransferase Ste14/membrane-associated phospholipid phosphatase